MRETQDRLINNEVEVVLTEIDAGFLTDVQGGLSRFRDRERACGGGGAGGQVCQLPEHVLPHGDSSLPGLPHRHLPPLLRPVGPYRHLSCRSLPLLTLPAARWALVPCPSWSLGRPGPPLPLPCVSVWRINYVQ